MAGVAGVAGGGGVGGVGGTGGTGPVAIFPRSPIPADLSEVSGQTALAGVWEGGIRLDVPGFCCPPADYMSLVLDDRSLRFFGFQLFGQFVRFSAGDPLGSVGIGDSFAGGQVRLIAASRTDTGFSVRYRLATGPGTQETDLEESLEGTLREGRLSLTYTIDGKLRGATVTGHGRGAGLLTRRGSRPPVPTALAGIVWSGEVDVEVPSRGPPGRDRLMLGFAADGRLDFVALQSLLGQTAQTFGQDVSVESARWAADSFDVSIRVRGTNRDYLETISGELGPQGLDARLTIRGQNGSSEPNYEASASGRLLP